MDNKGGAARCCALTLFHNAGQVPSISIPPIISRTTHGTWSTTIITAQSASYQEGARGKWRGKGCSGSDQSCLM